MVNSKKTQNMAPRKGKNLGEEPISQIKTEKDSQNVTEIESKSQTEESKTAQDKADIDIDTKTSTVRQCASFNCSNPAGSLKCPICIKMNLSPIHTYFCSQDCYKRNYKHHNIYIHGIEKARIERENGLKTFEIPKFDYTGALRPSFVTPMRTVPNSIAKPDYWQTGIPRAELFELRKGRKYIPMYDAAEIRGIRLACKLGREVLDIAGSLVRPGITTDEIDYYVHHACIERGCYPSPLNYNRFPKSCCTSVNEAVCHGIPDGRKLVDGDIVNIDISVYKDGYHGDLNETYLVGNVEQKYKDLVKHSYFSMMTAIQNVKPGIMCRKFGEIIDDYVRKRKLSAARNYCGHGIGRLLHCNPNIPHYKKNKAVGKCKPGMIFTIEPMINMGAWQEIKWKFDDWTSVTLDGKRSAQFEHTILVTKNGYEILTARTKKSVPFWWEVENKDNHVVENKEDQQADIKNSQSAENKE